jgi:hypothetical protein
VDPPEEDVELLRHFSRKLLDPPVVIKSNENSGNMGETVVPPDLKKLRARKVKRDDNDVVREAEVCKRSVICDDDEESDEKRKVNLKRKRVDEGNKPKRESIEFGPCASPPYKSRKVFSSKTSTKSVLSNSKVIAKHLAKSIPKPPNSLHVGFLAILKAYGELIEGDQFTDINKTVVTYVQDVFKCPDGYMSTQIYKEVTKIPSWSIPIAILCALVFTIIINSYWLCLFQCFVP